MSVEAKEAVDALQQMQHLQIDFPPLTQKDGELLVLGGVLIVAVVRPSEECGWVTGR